MLGFRRKPVTLHGARPRPRALTASGERVNTKNAEQQIRINSAWQRRAFMYYDALGEIKYAAAFFARLARLELWVGKWEVVDGERELVPTDDPQAVAALDRIRDPGGSGSRAALLASYGRIKFLSGEGYLFYTKDDDGMESWEFLSTSEIRPNPQGATGGRVEYQRVQAPQLAPELFRDPGEDEWENVDAKEAIGYRMWRRHPQYSQWPDSPMRGVLDVCEELLILDATVRARSRSRLAGNGILWLDDRISPAPAPTEDDGPEPDENVSNDPWLDDLTASIIEPIADEGDASRLVPYVTRVTVPLEPGLKLEELMYHQKFNDPAEVDAERGKRIEAINRLALGLELPAEILTGLGKSNHWSAWLLSDEAWDHLEPYAEEFVGDLTSAYLLPTLKAGGRADWDLFAVGYDAGRLRKDPEKSKNAKDVHDRGALSDLALRTANGFTEGDAPNDEERRVWLSRVSKDPGFALGEDPAPDRTQAEPEAGGVPGGVPSEPENETTPQGGSPSETVKGPPENETVASSVLVAAHVLGACEVAMQRARLLASSRLTSKAKRDPEVVEVIAAARRRNGGLPVHVPFVLGHDAVRRFGTERALVAGLDDVLAGPLTALVTAAQAAQIVRAIEEHAAMTLYDEHVRPLPAPLRSYITAVCAPAATNGSVKAAELPPGLPAPAALPMPATPAGGLGNIGHG